VQTRMAEVLFGDKSGYTGLARSEIYRWSTDPEERLYYPEDDRNRQRRAQVAALGAAYATIGPTRGPAVIRLSTRSQRPGTGPPHRPAIEMIWCKLNRGWSPSRKRRPGEVPQGQSPSAPPTATGPVPLPLFSMLPKMRRGTVRGSSLWEEMGRSHVRGSAGPCPVVPKCAAQS
jgi:hypothetical protein